MPSKTIGQIAIELELATSKFNARLAQIDKRMQRFGTKTDKTISFIKKSFGGLLAAETARRFATSVLRISDQMTELQGRVKNATKETGDFKQVWGELGGIAKKTGSDLNSTVSVFQRLSMARTELRATNADMLRFTESVQQLGVISGASTGAMSAGLTQLAQGLSAGVLRAEEFNSIVENIPAVAQAIGKGFGVSVGELRQMVIEGKVLSSDVLNAILSQTGEIQQAFNEMPKTIARATNELSISWDLLIAAMNDATGIAEGLANLISRTAENIRLLFGTTFDDRIDAVKRELKILRELADSPWTFKGDYIDRINELEAELRMLFFAQDRATQSVVRGSGELKKLGEAAAEASTELADMGGLIASKTGGVQQGLILANKKQQELLQSVKESKEEAARFAEEIANIKLSPEFERALKDVDKELQSAANTLSVDFVNALNEVNQELQEQQRLARMLEITWSDVMADTINNVSDAWSSFFLDVFHGKGLKSIEDFLNRVKEMFFQIIAEIAAKWVTSQIFGGLLGIGGAGGLPIIGGGGLGGLLGGASTSAGAGGAAIGGVAVAGAAGATVFPYASVTGAGVGGSIAGTALTGATVGGVATAGAGAATVFPYVSATGTGVGGAIGGTAIGTGAGGAGGGIAASGAFAGAAGALPVIGAFLAINALAGTPKKAVEFLRDNIDVPDFSTFKELSLANAGAVGTDQAGNFKSFLEQRGALGDTRTQDFEGLGSSFSSRTGKEGDPVVNLQKLYQEMERLKTLLPELEESAKTTFATMNIGAGDLTTALQDGVLTSTEQAQLGFIDLGEMSADQFAKITAAVDSGKLSIDGLTGATRLTHGELGRLGAIGVLSMQDIQTATGLTERQVEHLINSAREAGDAFGSAASQARNLANAVSSVPSISSGNISNMHSGGSFEVRGKAGVDANLVQFMATQGERVSVETPGSTRRQQSNVDMSEMVGRMDRLISYLEAA